ncbi:MAG: DnaA N-terminal domain-containing protein, partial [Actinomycetota bacterium]
VRPSQWRAIRDELLTVWDVTGGRWQHDRLTLTIAEANRKRIANQANGGNGGRAKSLKYKGRTIADATDPPSDDMPKTYPRYERDNLSVPDGTERGYPVADALQPPSPWDQVKGTFDAARRSAWLDQLVFAGVDDGSVVLLAPTRFVADWVGTNLGVDICRGFAAAGMAVRGIAVSVATSVNIAPASPAEASNHPSGGAAGSAGRGGRQ